jgi:hypothetical protein
MSIDPEPQEDTAPYSSTYLYVNDGPTVATDPSGQKRFECLRHPIRCVKNSGPVRELQRRREEALGMTAAASAGATANAARQLKPQPAMRPTCRDRRIAAGALIVSGAAMTFTSGLALGGTATASETFVGTLGSAAKGSHLVMHLSGIMGGLGAIAGGATYAQC